MIDRATIDRIMDATDIVDVISEFVTLRKRGTSYTGLCPFHDDKTPSFSVSPSKGVYKCFACGEAGNAVNFIMKHEQKTYPEALRWLANRYHIEIHDRELTADRRGASPGHGARLPLPGQRVGGQILRGYPPQQP